MNIKDFQSSIFHRNAHIRFISRPISQDKGVPTLNLNNQIINLCKCVEYESPPSNKKEFSLLKLLHRCTYVDNNSHKRKRSIAVKCNYNLQQSFQNENESKIYNKPNAIKRIFFSSKLGQNHMIPNKRYINKKPIENSTESSINDISIQLPFTNDLNQSKNTNDTNNKKIHMFKDCIKIADIYSKSFTTPTAKKRRRLRSNTIEKVTLERGTTTFK